MNIYRQVELFLSIAILSTLTGLLASCGERQDANIIAPSAVTQPADIPEWKKGTPVQSDLQFISWQKADSAGQLNKWYWSWGDWLCSTEKRDWISRYWGGDVDNCGHRMEIPPYALPQTSEMFIRIIDEQNMEIEFGKDTWFNRQVEITISYKNADLDGVDPNDLTIVWYDESNGQWYDVGGTVDLAHQNITAKVWHFTRYALSRR